MEPRILILSPQVFPEPHSGVGMRAHFQSVHLSRIWPITLATETGVYRVVDGVFTHLDAASVSECSNAVALVRSILRGTHYLFEKYSCRQWSIPPLDTFTHVIVHYPALLELLIDQRSSEVLMLFDTHNNEREYFETVAAETSNPIKRAVIRRQADVSERLIRKTQNALSATISVSESDRDWVAPLCQESSTHFVVPNNLFEYDPVEWNGSRSLLYVGSLNVTMNIQALNWFTNKVWPHIREEMPEVGFTVVGRDPASNLVLDLERKGVKVVANAPSLSPLYREAICSVIPAASGSGGKIKVCEALAHGVPVITTSHGLVGQPAAVKSCCIVEDEPSGWVRAIKTLASQGNRSSSDWDAKVKAALDSSYFGNSIQQISEFIASDGSRP